MQKYILMMLLIIGISGSFPATTFAAAPSCAVPEYSRMYFKQKAAIFKGVVQDIRQARRDDFDTVRPANVDNTFFATLNVTEVYQDNIHRDLRQGESAWLAYDAAAGAEFQTGEEILVLADRGYGDNRFWISSCNPTLRQQLLPDMTARSIGARILRSILR